MKKVFIFLTFVFLLLNVDFASAQSPQGTSYQAVIRTATGAIVSNQTVRLRFSIHDSAANGSVVYQETQTPVTTAQGLVNCNVGMGTALSSSFANINWGKKSKYLQVELDANGGTSYTDMGTTQLMSVPYALYATKAQKADTALYSASSMPSGTANGDMLYWNGTTWVKLAAGSGYGQLLAICDGVPSWGGCIPKVYTQAASSISSTTATCGGIVTVDGGSSVSSRGVCWSTSVNPTIALSTKSANGTGVGSFTISITGLAPNTTYYARAYATNSIGTAYGTQVNFTTTSYTVLPSVTIGTQTWTLKNLDVPKYRNGDVIPQVTDNIQWANLTTGAWCWWDNDSATNAAKYGRLYNWYAVNDPRGLAPQGWHVPSEAEWNKLVKYIDPSADTVCKNCTQSSTAGSALKSVADDLPWGSWDVINSTNSSGFTAVPGGLRFFPYQFADAGVSANFWTTNTDAANLVAPSAFIRQLYERDLSFTRGFSLQKTCGLSVRLVRD